MRWNWDKKVQRYRDTKTGKFLGADKLKSLIYQNNDQLAKRIDALNTLVINDKIPVGQWESEVRENLKNLHISSYLLGKGGSKQLTARDYGLIGAQLSKEFQHLRGVSRDLVLGDRLSERKFRARMAQYINRSHSIYELGRREGHQTNGYQWECRHRAAIESCPDCIVYEAAGWQPIGTLARIGEQCACRSNCRCYFEWSIERPVDQLIQERRSLRFGWLK